ncbi:hypothetical protein H8959_011738 [Pygathrix nigripes]
MELMFAEWEDGERFSFEDSDRFEEDSLCSFISEAESLCQNWRGWRKQSAGPNSPTGGGGGGGSGGTRMRAVRDQELSPTESSLQPGEERGAVPGRELSPTGSCPKLRTDFRTRFSGFPGALFASGHVKHLSEGKAGTSPAVPSSWHSFCSGPQWKLAFFSS